MFGIHRRRNRHQESAASEIRLQEAEKELEDLKCRADAATCTLSDRHHRNHWRESIEILIHGGV